MKTIPFSIRFSQKIHDLVQDIAKYSGKTPTNVIENALQYQRLDFRMRHIALQEDKHESLLRIMEKWEQNDFISPEEYAFLVGVIHRNYVTSYNVGIRQIEVLVELTKKIEMYLDANLIEYDKNHINKYLDDNFFASLRQSGRSVAAEMITRPLEHISDYFNEVDPIRLHETFAPNLNLLLPVALYDENTNYRNTLRIESINHKKNLESLSLDFGDMKVTFNNMLFLTFESKAFFLPIGGHKFLFLVYVLQNWNVLKNSETVKYKNLYITQNIRESKIEIEYHALRISLTHQQFQEMSVLITQKLSDEWSSAIDTLRFSIGSLW